MLKASATFANGTTWTGDFGVTAHKSELSTETNAYENVHGWLDCEGGWKSLPSGKVRSLLLYKFEINEIETPRQVICYVQSSKDVWNRKSTCQMAGAYLMELKTRDDAQRFLHLMFKFAKTSTSSFALGATAKTIGNNTIWVWDHSGDEIQVCTHGCLLKTSSDSVDVAPQVGRSLYFDPVHSPGSSDIYLDELPYFDLYVRAAPETDATYFFCMKVLSTRL